jgi:serine/threonine protein kinase
MLFEDQKNQDSKATLAIENSKQFEVSDFEIIKTLGQGSFGTVKLVKNKRTKFHFAMKCLVKKDIRGRK